jgi:hypothetical protein
MNGRFLVRHVVVVVFAVGAALPGRADDAARKPPTLDEQFQAINLADASKWEMFLDPAQRTKAELVESPIFVWTNPTKGKGQHGSVFVWTHDGRPMVVGSIFVNRTETTQRLMHEFHSLAPLPLHPRCAGCGGESWEPTAGIALQPLRGAPRPDESAAKRLLQIRTLARQFGGYTFDDWRKLRWELRSLPQPLYRYQPQSGEVIDGALLALVTDAGTDPEVLLLLEARRHDGWQFALLRFSDSSLYVSYQSKEIWKAVRGEGQEQFHNADHTYQLLRMRFVDPSELQDSTSKP